MSNVIELNAAKNAKRAEELEDFNGLCPVCKSAPLIRNIHKTHVAACDKHRVCWNVGWNLFSSWQHEDEQTWRENAALLETYREVEPYYFPRKRQATTGQPANADFPF